MRTSKFRWGALAAVGVMLCALSTHAGTYTWVGVGGDHDWTVCANWTHTGGHECYPSNINESDNATIPYNANAGGWSIELEDNYMWDLTVLGSVNFSSETSNNKLHFDSITIGSSGTTHDIVLTISAQIDTHHN